MKNMFSAEKLPEWFRELSEEEKKSEIRILRREDNGLLYHIAMDSSESLSIRRLAVRGAQDQELLCRIAKLCDEDTLREAAAHRIFKLDADFPESKERRSIFRVEPHLFLLQAIEEKDHQFLEYIARTSSGTVRHNAILALPTGHFPELDDDTAYLLIHLYRTDRAGSHMAACNFFGKSSPFCAIQCVHTKQGGFRYEQCF